MSTTKLKVVPYNKIYKDSAKEVLTEAIDLDFDSVVVIGFRGDEVSTRYSAHTSFVKVVGAIEQAKYVMLSQVNE